mmetsp:Transcript_15872/g.28471  ORF Transcript_15872/g.28471 Transcript_15872/m.28471 type:complete len:333 (-) Transcript_15872:63-1061(-)
MIEACMLKVTLTRSACMRFSQRPEKIKQPPRHNERTIPYHVPCSSFPSRNRMMKSRINGVKNREPLAKHSKKIENIHVPGCREKNKCIIAYAPLPSLGSGSFAALRCSSQMRSNFAMIFPLRSASPSGSRSVIIRYFWWAFETIPLRKLKKNIENGPCLSLRGRRASFSSPEGCFLTSTVVSPGAAFSNGASGSACVLSLALSNSTVAFSLADFTRRCDLPSDAAAPFGAPAAELGGAGASLFVVVVGLLLVCSAAVESCAESTCGGIVSCVCFCSSSERGPCVDGMAVAPWVSATLMRLPVRCVCLRRPLSSVSVRCFAFGFGAPCIFVRE